MRVVNFFAGEGTWSAPFSDRGHSVWRTDIKWFPGISFTEDILDLKLADIPPAQIVLASPDCTAFSVASLGTHWGGGHRAYIPKTPKAHNRMALVYKTVALIEAMVARDGLEYGVIENPRGMLRKLGILDRYDRVEVSYCRYGDTRMKPTDLWFAPGKPLGFQAREMCKNGNPDHEAAPRGAKTGTQGLEKQARSHMPYELGLDVCLAAERRYGPSRAAGDVHLASPQGFAFWRSLVDGRRQHFLTPFTPAQLAEVGQRYLVTAEGFSAAGVLIKKDGELSNLFNHGMPKGTGEYLARFAISKGANRVEYFDEPHLADLYGRLGFKVEERYPFDLEVIRQDFPDYDPERRGRPDYVIARRS